VARGAEAGDAAPPRPPHPPPLRQWPREVHRLRALRRRLPGGVHLRRTRREPQGSPLLPGRAVRRALRDQPDALHLLRLLRRGLPHRGDHPRAPLRPGRLPAGAHRGHQGGAARGLASLRAGARTGRAARRRLGPARSRAARHGGRTPGGMGGGPVGTLPGGHGIASRPPAIAGPARRGDSEGAGGSTPGVGTGAPRGNPPAGGMPPAGSEADDAPATPDAAAPAGPEPSAPARPRRRRS
jgi:hypothetical protein